MSNETEKILHEYLDLNLARVKAMAGMILAMIASRSVQLSTLSRFFHGSVKSDSAFKRMQRFLRQISLPKNNIAQLILAILGFERDEKLTLILDRTNWKFGRSNLNILFLSVVWRGVGVPLFFKFLEDKSQGNSSYIDRIELTERAIALFGRTRIAVLLGDREFVGKQWILWLRKSRIPFVMRLNHANTKISDEEDVFVMGDKIFSKLKKGRKKFLNYCLVGENDSFKCCVAALRSFDDELVVVIHSEDIASPLAHYQRRWKIESMFRSLKTGGFNLENTHVTDPKRLTTLISIVAIAFSLAVKAGSIAVENGDDCHIKKRLHGFESGQKGIRDPVRVHSLHPWPKAARNEKAVTTLQNRHL